MTLIKAIVCEIMRQSKSFSYIGIILFFTIGCLVSNAAERREDRLYSVDLQVADQSDLVRREAAKEALLTVLSRLTGLSDIPRTGPIVAALGVPDRYYSKFDYVKPPVLDRSKILNIRFTFQAEAMLALLRSSGLPIWWTKRPQTVAWVVVEKAGKRSIVGTGDNSSLSNEIFVQADLRGLPIGLPLMDLDDSILVSVSDIWGKFTQVLTSASIRYEAAQYLIGRFSVQEILGERLYSGEWQLMKVENKSEESIVQAGLFNEAKIVSTRSLQAQNIQEVALRGVDIATTSLAEEFAIFGGEPKYHQIRVSGLDSLKGYSNLVSYLSGFEFIQKVNILALQDDVISLQIISPASLERLVSLLALEGRLVDTTLVDSPPQMGWRG